MIENNLISAERNILAALDAAFQGFIQLPQGAFDTDAEKFKDYILAAQKIILARIGVKALTIQTQSTQAQAQIDEAARIEAEKKASE